MFSILFLLLGSLWDLCAATSSAEEYYAFETRNGVRTLGPKALKSWIEGDMPKQHKGALVDRKDLKARISIFFEAYPTPDCYTNDATVEALRVFSQKSDEEIARYGNAYIAAIDASFDNMYKLQSAGKLARDLKCEEIFSEEEREGLRGYSYVIEKGISFLEPMQYSDPWSSTILHMGLGENFPAPKKENPVSGRAAARTVIANVVFDMTSQKTTEDRVERVMKKYGHAFAVIPIRCPYILDRKLEKERTVLTNTGLQQGRLILPTKGQLIFQYYLDEEDWKRLTRFCALVPTFGFVWEGPGFICGKEGGYSDGSFCNMLFGVHGKRKLLENLYREAYNETNITRLQEPPQEGYERFLFWHTYGGGYGMGVLSDEKVELPIGGEEKSNVRFGVFFCSFMQPEYYEQDQAGPGKNYLNFKNVALHRTGRFSADGKKEFFIIEKKTS